MIIIQFATAKYWNYVFKNIGNNIDKRFDIDLSTVTYKNEDILFYRATGHFYNNDTAE